MKLTACALTDVGLRRKNNEDCVFADSDNGLFIVADGMGGHAAGEVASQMAVETLRDFFPPRQSPPENPADCLPQAFHEANARILAAANSNPTKKGMGTTLSVLYITADKALLAHVGDSRIYRPRQTRLEQLSIDHSLVAEQLRQGLITTEDARNSQMRNILLQAVGLENTIDIFCLHLSPQPDDLFLLCSDGLTDMLDDHQISQLLAQECPLDQLAVRLVDAAKTAGGRDNIGVVVVKIAD
jgi:protein phosphatase